MLNRTRRPLTTSALIAELLAENKTAEVKPEINAGQLKQRLKSRTDEIENHLSTLPRRLHQSRCLLAWKRYTLQADDTPPGEHKSLLGGVIYHSAHLMLEDEEKPLIDRFIAMLNELKSEFTDEVVRILTEAQKTPPVTLSVEPCKPEKERLREQIQRLSEERDQAKKENRIKDAARIDSLICTCEARLFYKPIKDSNIQHEAQKTTAFYFRSVTGSEDPGRYTP
jgi:hypothetical protein